MFFGPAKAPLKSIWTVRVSERAEVVSEVAPILHWLFCTVLVELTGDPIKRARLGAAARALVEANRGARGKTLAVLAELLPRATKGVVRPFRVVH